MLTVYFLLYLMCVVAFIISDWINLKQLQFAKVPNTHISVRLFFVFSNSRFRFLPYKAPWFYKGNIILHNSLIIPM